MKSNSIAGPPSGSIFLILLIFSSVFVITSCGSMPKQHLFANEARVPSDFDAAWEATVSFFAENNIPIKAIEKESGLIMAESQTFPDDWIDCGKASLFEKRMSPVGTFNVHIRNTADGQVNLQVNATFQCERWDTYNNRPIGSMTCYSTGIFEQLLLDEIANKAIVVEEERNVAATEKEVNISYGTGFIVSTSGEIVTCNHVIEGKNFVQVRFRENATPIAADVVVADKKNDIVVLRLDNPELLPDSVLQQIPLRLKIGSDLAMGAKVFTLGFPLGDILHKEASYGEGIISSKSGIEDDPRIFQISIPLQPGNSGGPVITDSGYVVGMVVSTLDANLINEYFGAIPQNVNFAIKAEYINNLLSYVPDFKATEGLPQIASPEKISNYVVRVEAR